MYNPPKGIEKKILKKYKLLEKESFDRAELSTPHLPCGYGFALEGVRTNGTEHLSSLSSFLYEWDKGMKTAEEELLSWMIQFKKIKQLVKALRKDVKEHFKVCSKCKGKGGKKIHQVEGMRIRIWEDCEKCDGRGLIPNG